ncbi:DMT family transporter, partial [Pygmaiobacter massiliensis]|uniref:DMT family transporter n=1 Tax=Pygmaiobacter massiliensis TaxID=1917873 RepID=UPI002A811706
MKARVKMLAAMLIFGSIGLFVRQIPIESSVIVLWRSVIGSLFLAAVLLLRGQKLNLPALRRQLPLLLVSGAVMGANWVCLFEAYRYTTVSAATLAYYCAPVFVLLASPLVLKEKLTWPRLVGITAAMAGMVLVGGREWTGGASSIKGIQLGLAAAALYATLMLLGKFVRDLSGLETTLVRLVGAAAVMAGYLAFSGIQPSLPPMGLPLAALIL